MLSICYCRWWRSCSCWIYCLERLGGFSSANCCWLLALYGGIRFEFGHWLIYWRAWSGRGMLAAMDWWRAWPSGWATWLIGLKAAAGPADAGCCLWSLWRWLGNKDYACRWSASAAPMMLWPIPNASSSLCSSCPPSCAPIWPLLFYDKFYCILIRLLLWSTPEVLIMSWSDWYCLINLYTIVLVCSTFFCAFPISLINIINLQMN